MTNFTKALNSIDIILVHMYELDEVVKMLCEKPVKAYFPMMMVRTKKWINNRMGLSNNNRMLYLTCLFRSSETGF